MAAAYGALLSLTNTIHQIQNHPRPPISLHKTRIQPLIEKVAFLQDFLENYVIDDDDTYDLAGRMVDAAHEAEDIIESHIADHIKVRGKSRLYRYLQKMTQKMTLCINNNNSLKKDSIESHIADHSETRGEANITWHHDDDDDSCLYRELHKVMYDFDSITKDVAAAIKDKGLKKIVDATTEDDVMNDDVILDKLTNSPYSEGAGGSNDVMIDVMGKLTDRQSSRWIIGIAGMGGIGKTTLAKNIYEHPLIVEHFDMRGWSTISQEYNSKRILLDVLHCIGCNVGEDSEYEELGNKLYQSLFGRRCLIVMDDIWGTDAWEEVKRFFPNNDDDDDGSRVLITTRASKVALQMDGRDYFQMPFLNLDESWNLLQRCVFGEKQGWPPELEEIGKEIAEKCRGLPLSIVVIGGLLAKSEQTSEKWQHILKNISSIVNLEEDERCFQILKLSYNQLPVQLKPCFLYMGMFREDQVIYVPRLLDLWVGEGLVKPAAGKSLETIAREVCLNDLVCRNLIMVRKWDFNRGIIECNIHDLLRDLCIKEAEKYKFFRTTPRNYCSVHDQSQHAQCCINIIQRKKYNHPLPLPEAVQSATRARTLILIGEIILPSLVRFKLLRVLITPYHRISFSGELIHMVNLRHLNIIVNLPEREFPPEIYLLWNLRTLRIRLERGCPAMLDIWQMPQLRHVEVYSSFQLTNPPPPPPPPPPPHVDVLKNGWMVLENLETLELVYNLRLGEEVIERIPNIKRLGITNRGADFGLDSLCRLHNLEALALDLSVYPRKSEVMIMFPVSLRRLTLYRAEYMWEEMGTMIGSLPHLEALEICNHAFEGPEWETTEGGFLSLKYLVISGCYLEQWRVEATHFPCLQRLDLYYLDKLKEIPLGIGEITTLREIQVRCCLASAVLSAKEILEVQEECFGEVELQIRVELYKDDTQLPDLTSSRNFTVERNIGKNW